jgi:hypothetical protein
MPISPDILVGAFLAGTAGGLFLAGKAERIFSAKMANRERKDFERNQGIQDLIKRTSEEPARRFAEEE